MGEVEDLESEKILAAYPEDRIRDQWTSLHLIAAAVKAGVKPDDLVQAVKAYAKESEGYTRSKVCFSDNWFKMRRWDKAHDGVAVYDLEVIWCGRRTAMQHLVRTSKNLGHAIR